MNLKLSIPTKLSRGAKVTAAILLAVLAGGAFLYWQFHANPPKPWVLKWRISQYLKKQTHRSDFSIDFAFPSKAEMRTAPPVPKSKTGAGGDATDFSRKDFDTLKKEYIELKVAALALRRESGDLQTAATRKRLQLTTLEKQLAAAQAAAATNLMELQENVGRVRAQVAVLEKELPAKQLAADAKEQAVEPVLDGLLAYQREWAALQQTPAAIGASALAAAHAALTKSMQEQFDNATSYETMYRFIGQELWVAGRLFDSANPAHRRVALNIARQAGRDALYQAENGWLASCIYKAYVSANLDVAENQAALDNLVNECADMLRRAGDSSGMLDIYKSLLVRATTRQRADAVRVQISQAYEQNGEYQEAANWLKQIKTTNDFRWAIQRIPKLERQAKK